MLTRFNRPLVCVQLTILLLALSAPSSDAGDWPQWRGPDRNGVQPEAAVPLAWSDTTNIQWKTPLPGMGISSPITWQSRIFIAAAERQRFQDTAVGLRMRRNISRFAFGDDDAVGIGIVDGGDFFDEYFHLLPGLDGIAVGKRSH